MDWLNATPTWGQILLVFVVIPVMLSGILSAGLQAAMKRY